ncbi:MAG: energy transducer TonB [Pseudomonadota bacterium]
MKDARVVKAEPPGIFDRPALDAVQRFRFRPRTMGPLAVEVTGVQNRIRFRLEKP